jgi:hypothetical protein
MKTNNMNTPMRLNVQQLKIRSLHRPGDWVERQILALGAKRQIDEARGPSTNKSGHHECH